MQLIMIRHARPAKVETSDGSPADPPLTEAGHRQAQAMADWLASEHIDAIHVSPMLRARQTAAPLEAALGLTAIVTDGIAEFDRDADHYMPMDQLREEDYERWKAMMAGEDNMGLEDPVGFQQTVVEATEGIVANHGGQNVAVVCHGMVIASYLAHVLDRAPGDTMFVSPGYAGITRIMASSAGARSMGTFNEQPHFRGLDSKLF